MGERELFVWYRVKRRHGDEARAFVIEMQRSLAEAWPGLQARLLVRNDAASSTWMETYARPAPAVWPGIDAKVEASIVAAAAGLASFVDGDRHLEAFEVVGRA